MNVNICSNGFWDLFFTDNCDRGAVFPWVIPALTIILLIIVIILVLRKVKI